MDPVHVGEEVPTVSDQTPQDPPPSASGATGDAGRSAASAEDAAVRAERAAKQAARDRAESFVLAEAARDAALEAARKAGRFSREFMVTVISVVTTAFGVVVALAWNTALTAALTKAFGLDGRVAALFVYALLITFLAVIAIVFMSRIAKRIGAAPVEFKIEGAKKE